MRGLLPCRTSSSEPGARLARVTSASVEAPFRAVAMVPDVRDLPGDVAVGERWTAAGAVDCAESLVEEVEVNAGRFQSPAVCPQDRVSLALWDGFRQRVERVAGWQAEGVTLAPQGEQGRGNRDR